MGQITDSERFVQLQLNKKITEIKIKDKEIEELRDLIEQLNRRLQDNSETINILSKQVASLVCKHHIHD